MSRAAYVLVEGRSSRIGKDKALLPFRVNVNTPAEWAVYARD